MIKLKNVFKALLVTVLLAISAGCARTVTDKNTILQMEVEMTFRGQVNSSAYHYFFIVSGAGSPTLPNPSLQEYFPSPGLTLDINNLHFRNKGADQEARTNFYYTEYFDTWSDYIIVADDQAQLIKSRASSFDATTTENLVYAPETTFTYSSDIGVTSEKTIKFTFQLQDLSVSPTLLYYKLASSQLVGDGSETGNLMDIIEGSISPIQLKSNEDISRSDPEDGTNVPAGADLISWRIRIF